MDKIKTQSPEAKELTDKHRPLEAAKRLKETTSQPFEYGTVNYLGTYPQTWRPDFITITIYKDEPINRPLTTDEISTITAWEAERYKKIKELENG
jgi:hypothetical protein